jgi:hypothetical protein
VVDRVTFPVLPGVPAEVTRAVLASLR